MRVLPQLLRFLLGGGIGVLAYYALYWSLTELAGVWYIAAAVVSSVANCIINFLAHKFWTFRDPRREMMREQGVLYGCLFSFLFLLNLALLHALVEWAGLWHLWAQLISTIVVTAISYFVSRRIFAE